MDYLPTKSAKIPILWTMPKMEGEISEVLGPKALNGIDISADTVSIRMKKTNRCSTSGRPMELKYYPERLEKTSTLQKISKRNFDSDLNSLRKPRKRGSTN